MSDTENASADTTEETFLDGCLRPWGRTPKPRVPDPWNWIPDFGTTGETRYFRVRVGPPPPAGTWPSGPPAYETARPRIELAEACSSGKRVFEVKLYFEDGTSEIADVTDAGDDWQAAVSAAARGRRIVGSTARAYLRNVS